MPRTVQTFSSGLVFKGFYREVSGALFDGVIGLLLRKGSR